MALTLLSLVLDAGVAPPGGSAYPWLAAIQNGLASAVCMTLMINGFVGFQLYEDGTPLSVLLLRGSATAMFALSFVISVLTFNGIGSLSPTQTLPLFVVLYVLNAVCLAVYVVMQTLLVATLGDRWPLGHIFFGVGSFVAGQVLLYAFSTTICERTKHYVDGLLFATFCNLVSVMMVYRVRFSLLCLSENLLTLHETNSIGTPSQPPTSNFRSASSRTIGSSKTTRCSTKIAAVASATATMCQTMRHPITTNPIKLVGEPQSGVYHLFGLINFVFLLFVWIAWHLACGRCFWINTYSSVQILFLIFIHKCSVWLRFIYT